MGEKFRKMKLLDISKKRFDRPLLWSVIVLIVIGTVMLYSSSTSLSLAKTNGQTDTYFLIAHLKRLVVGILVLGFFMIFDYRKLKSLAPFLIVIAIMLLIYTKGWYLLKGFSSPGRWLYLGTYSLQTSDIARIALIIYLAAFMAKKKNQLDDFYSGFFPPLLVMALLIGLIILQPDFSTGIMLCIIGTMMLFIGGARFIQLTAAGAVAALITIPMMLSIPYSRSRILSWLSGNDDVVGAGYQITQSLISLGNGGLFGMGLGNSIAKNQFLPTPHTDFILAIIGEETGLIGVMVLLTLFLIIFQRGIKIAKESNDTFGVLLALGLSFSIILYAFINAAVVTNIFPVTGLPIPLVSYGGSSLLTNMIALG
ncbi:MAG: FtsW/RodA/SpoVE family cell cycle protein, partial [Planctomycetia bacterium]|nr:FtsW/RodA/SpoVE family cell cycle protein [Planctomycetia bacterium]